VIQLAISLLTALAALTSGRAALLWYRAAQLEAPPQPLTGKNHTNRVAVDITPLVEWSQESGRRNKAAARWSAAAAGLGFLAGMLSAYAAWPLHGP
jgi:hypothetical protein